MPHPVNAMLPRLAWAFMLLCLFATSGVAQDGTGVTLSTSRAAQLQIPVGESRVFTTAQDIQEVVIGDAEIADVVVVSPRSFFILGQSLGQTNLQVFSEDALVGLVDLEITVDTGDLASVLRGVGGNVRAESVNGRLRLSGTVPDAVTLTRVLEIADQYGSDAVVNAIDVVDPQQVFLKVRMIEASREAGQAIGLGVVAQSDSNDRLQLGTGRIANPVPFGSFLATLVEDGISVNLLIEALEERGLVRNLAEPTLAALSGETASFLAGGEVPIPVAQDGDEVSVEYKEFGVRLSFTPVVLGNGLINLTLEPEVSQLDLNNTYNTGTIELPSFSTRRASTTIELRAGQSFVIAGLLQRNNARRRSQVPWLGSVPVLGALFRSASWQKDETDLVIIVTPYLNKPGGPTERIATPLDDSILTTEGEFFLTGTQEITRGELERRLRRRSIDGPFGHIIEGSSGG
ncbi:type II and III secretion system protein family protein [uncultured Paracoccus sp.]|uniref:type II and III secretion system protein family protein n=1 Tax=uncultured Paracoccus sp. TaxID=189685 RepID=UPI00262C4943|nr:type II and III secretion system protein family protein [uncultured Paracoccus sp.]